MKMEPVIFLRYLTYINWFSLSIFLKSKPLDNDFYYDECICIRNLRQRFSLRLYVALKHFRFVLRSTIFFLFQTIGWVT